MSLIVDINPVPWEILDLVRARILKNRAKKQKRQPEKPGELRRVMQADNGILAKQRWEEPSFINDDSGPYIAIVNVNAAKDDNFTIKLNGETLRDVDMSLNEKTGYLFIWSNNNEDIEKVKQKLNAVLALTTNVPGNIVWADVVTVESSLPQPGDSAKIEMINIKNNNNGNAGVIYLGFIEQPGSTDVNPGRNAANVSARFYFGPSGFNLTYELKFPFPDD